MEFDLLLPIIFITTFIIYVYVPIAGLICYYRPLQNKLWVNIVGIILTALAWPIVPIILVLRHKDRFLTNLFWIAFVIWMCSVSYFIVQNIELVQDMMHQYKILPANQ